MRKLASLPILDMRVRLVVRARKFFCDRSRCRASAVRRAAIVLAVFVAAAVIVAEVVRPRSHNLPNLAQNAICIAGWQPAAFVGAA